ncbi:MAG: RluA family pseudouridine synthase [Methyloligellaceae bacterium]
MVEHYQVDATEDGMRLDRWFRAHFPSVPHGHLQKLLRTGQVRVEGGRAKANTRLLSGQQVRVPPIKAAAQKRSRPDLSAEDIAFVRSLVILEDSHVFAINKPAGLAVQGGTKTGRHLDGLLDGLQMNGAERPRLVHRLDKDTSGVLLLARTRTAAQALGQALKEHSAKKLYWALVVGVPDRAVGIINLPLQKSVGRDGERVRVSEPDSPAAQSAQSHYCVIEKAGQRLAWLAMTPVTGRTHQLRVHAAAMGHPVVGDGKYGGTDAFPGGEIQGKLHLHTRTIVVPSPAGGTLYVDAPLPDHMRSSWEMLGFDADASADPYVFDNL